MGLTFAIIILVLTFVLTWSARHHDRNHGHDLEFLDTTESHDRVNHP